MEECEGQRLHGKWLANFQELLDRFECGEAPRCPGIYSASVHAGYCLYEPRSMDRFRFQ